MDYDNNSSTTDAGHDAKAAAMETADTIKNAAGDVAGQARQSASKVADQVQQTGQKAMEATRTYARDAIDSAGRKVDDMKSQLDTARTTATEYIHEDPVRAVKVAAIGSALLTAVLIHMTRRSR